MSRWSTHALIALLGLGLVGCASNAETGFPDPSEVPTDAGKVTCADAVEEAVEYDEHITVLDNCYVPKVTTVAAGEEVEWIQEGVAPHNVKFVELDVDSHPDCSASNSSGCMQEGDEFIHAFEDAGEFLYYCVIHGTASGDGMAGTLIVE